MNEHLLIALVKNQPVLYDRYSPDSKDPLKREIAWTAIAKAFNISVEDCMRAWRNLRERYAKELKLVKDEAAHEPRWSLFDSLAFLQPHIKPRVKLSNVHVIDRASEVLLISLVEKYPELYDKQSDNFKNIERRECSWKSIAEVLNMPIGHCMRLWRNLRERYTKELKLMKKTNLHLQQQDPRWYLFNRLTFLEPHIRPRKIISKLKRSPSTTSSPQDSTQFVFNHQDVHKMEVPLYIGECEDLEQPNDPMGNSSSDTVFSESAIPEYIVLPAHKQEYNDTAMQTDFEESSSVLTNQQPCSDIAFGNYIGQYLSELHDLRKKNQLKINIIQLLHGDDNQLSD